MFLRTGTARACFAFVIVAASVAAPWHAVGQTPPTPTPTTPGSFPPPFAPAGVVVDADGVLRKKIFADPTGQLTRQRVAEAKAALDPKLAVQGRLRKVSLTRLEKAIEARLEAGQKPTDEMLCLAGMTRLRNVFVYPDSGDVVIAGPAEGWARDLSGRVVGMFTGRPVLELQDLVVALRAYPPHEKRGPLIGCSIDPTKEGLAQMQQFLRRIGTQIDPDQTDFIVDGLRTSLGLQKVRIEGVPPETHFAQVMVEADYRMKLIGIGLEDPPVKLVSYVARANPAAVSRNALQRWYFVPDYKCVRTSDDRLAMELVGEGVKLVGADEAVGGDGQRHRAGKADAASAAFVSGFTKKYPELATRSPVYAQLRNLIDMAVAAAFIQEHDYYGKAHWNMDTFASEAKFPVETYNAPVEVESAVNSIWKNNQLMTPIGGGVTVRAHEALEPDNLLSNEGGKVEKTYRATGIEGLAEGQWWWD
ncbi:MAG: DUF1598 domain-containing protein [Planctomycetia bacterium]|nr:DUF1598 domain-containing protein [Planctomycetia bacterium]